MSSRKPQRYTLTLQCKDEMVSTKDGYVIYADLKRSHVGEWVSYKEYLKLKQELDAEKAYAKAITKVGSMQSTALYDAEQKINLLKDRLEFYKPCYPQTFKESDQPPSSLPDKHGQRWSEEDEAKLTYLAIEVFSGFMITKHKNRCVHWAHVAQALDRTELACKLKFIELIKKGLV